MILQWCIMCTSYLFDLTWTTQPKDILRLLAVQSFKHSKCWGSRDPNRFLQGLHALMGNIWKRPTTAVDDIDLDISWLFRTNWPVARSTWKGDKSWNLWLTTVSRWHWVKREIRWQGGANGFKVLGKLEDRNWVVKQSYDQLWLYFECFVKVDTWIWVICFVIGGWMEGWMDGLANYVIQDLPNIVTLFLPRGMRPPWRCPTSSCPRLWSQAFLQHDFLQFGLQTPNQSMFQFNWNLYLDQLAQSI